MRTKSHHVRFVLALVVDPGADQLLAEDAADSEEVVIAFEGVERLCERARHLYDATVLLEEIPIRRLAGVEALLDPVQSRHEHGREGEVRAGGRIMVAELDTICLRGIRVQRYEVSCVAMRD